MAKLPRQDLPQELQDRSDEFKRGFRACLRGEDRDGRRSQEWLDGWDTCRADHFVDQDLSMIEFPDVEVSGEN